MLLRSRGGLLIPLEAPGPYASPIGRGTESLFPLFHSEIQPTKTGMPGGYRGCPKEIYL